MIISTLFIVLAYLLGSLSAAIILCRLYGLEDPRLLGSKNAGATNVMRMGGKKIAIQVFLLDALKGFIAVAFVHSMELPTSFLGWIAVVVVLGHIFPIYHQFKGGKGIATVIGALAALDLRLFICFLLIWLGMYKLKGYSSLASITAISSLPVLTVFFNFDLFLPMTLLAFLVLFMHRENIQRLREGNETTPTDIKN